MQAIGRAGIAALALVVTAGAARPLPAIDENYASIVRTYHDGGADAAVAHLVGLDRQSLEADFRIFVTAPPIGMMAAAAALHTEAALRPRVRTTVGTADFHLRLAAAIIEVGQPKKIPSLAAMPLKPSVVGEVPAQFRRLWYLAVLEPIVRAALLAAGVAVAGAFGATEASQQTFRSRVDLVRADALVTDGGQIVAGLTSADFEVRDNGVLQTIESVVLEALPLAVTFVLDTSGSVAGGKMSHLSSAVDIVLKGLHAQDRTALVTFSHRVWQRKQLGPDVAAVRRGLTAARAAGGTALRDAVFAGLALTEPQDARALVLVFSDGLDNASWLDAETVERAARRADAVVYSVAVGAVEITSPIVTPGGDGRVVIPGTNEYVPGQTDFLEAIASATGGRVIKADTTGNLPKAFDEILQEFRTRYLITYSPRGADTPGWHAIDVKVKGRRAQVRARRGYERS